MHPFSIDDLDSVSEAALARVSRKIPNAATVFADDDPDMPEFHRSALFQLQAFSKADHIAARLAASGAAPASPWILEFGPAKPDISPVGEMVWATSRQEALAVALEACRAGLYLPDRIDFSQDLRCTAFARGQMLFSVYPLPPAVPLGEYKLKRAYSTLVGCRKSESPRDELCKRMTRWPGAERLSIDPRDTGASTRLRHAHLPVPAEWLLTARLLLERGGMPSDANAQQAFVALVFGAKDYNTLIRGSADRVATLGGPWYVSANDGAGGLEFKAFADPFSAFVELMAMYRARESAWSAPTLEFDSWGPTGALNLTVAAAPDEPQSGESLPRLSLGQLSCLAPENDGGLGAVATALRGAADDPSLIEDLFMVRLTHEERFAEHTAHAGMRPIAQHGLWRFLESGDGSDPSQPGLHLDIVRVDGFGNVLVRKSIPLYKGGLAFNEQSREWVFFADYDYTRPVAAVPSLPEAVVALLQSILVGPRPWRADVSVAESFELDLWRQKLARFTGV